MKRTILCAAMITIFTAGGAAAQTSDANSNASSGSSSNSASTSNTVNQPQATANSNQSTTAVSGSSSYGNVGNTTTNTMTPTANSNANSQTASQAASNNAGNSQTINFNTAAQPAQTMANTNGRMENVLSGSTTSNVNSTARSESMISGEQTVNHVNSGEQTVRYEYSGTQTVKNVPSIAAAPLTSSNDTCMGSYSAGVAVPGIGITGGSTYSDEHCKRIKMSRELWNKGMKAASLAIDCMDRDAREALELTGFVCPQTLRDQRAAATAAAYQGLQALPAGRLTRATYYPPPLGAEALATEPPALQPSVETAERAPARPLPIAAPQVAVSDIPPPRDAPVAGAIAAVAAVVPDESVVVRRVDPQRDTTAAAR